MLRRRCRGCASPEPPTAARTRSVFSIQSRNRGERDCALLLVLRDQGHDVGLILRRLLSPAIRKLPNYFHIADFTPGTRGERQSRLNEHIGRMLRLPAHDEGQIDAAGSCSTVTTPSGSPAWARALLHSHSSELNTSPAFTGSACMDAKLAATAVAPTMCVSEQRLSQTCSSDRAELLYLRR